MINCQYSLAIFKVYDVYVKIDREILIINLIYIVTLGMNSSHYR